MARYSYPGVYLDEINSPTAIKGVATFVVGLLIGVAASVAADGLRRRYRRT